MALRLIMFGTPEFAVPTFEFLLRSGHAVVGAVTQPDRPRGRGQKLTPSPIKVRALDAGVPVFQPERMRDASFHDSLRGLKADLGIVAAYGRILPEALLDLPRLGMINVHASLLPRWRGAAPIQRAIMAGDAAAGVTIMRVVKALDAGPMLAKVPIPIGPDDTSVTLESTLAKAGARLLVDVVDRYEAGPVHLEPQDERLVTYADKIEKSDSPIDWARTVRQIHDQIRALQPWPQASTWLAGRRLLIRRSEVVDVPVPEGAAPGTVVLANGDLLVAASDGMLRVLEVQPEGRGPMSADAFRNGHPIEAGARLTTPGA